MWLGGITEEMEKLRKQIEDSYYWDARVKVQYMLAAHRRQQ